MWIGVFSIFGASFFMMTDAAYQCVTGFGCDDAIVSAGRLLLAPQMDMGNSIDRVVAINEEIATEQLSESDIAALRYEASSYQKQIIASIMITVLLFILFTWLFIKSMTTLNATDYMFAGFLALAVIAALQIGIGYFIYGEFSMPFIGFIKLFENPEVLIGVINYSEVLPMNQSIPNGTG